MKTTRMTTPTIKNKEDKTGCQGGLPHTRGHRARQTSAPPGRGTQLRDGKNTQLQALYAANIDFMTQAQSLQKMCQVFRDAGELAAADSLTYYLVAYGQDPPPL